VKHNGFIFRGVYECGWNLFIRDGFKATPDRIRVHYAYIDHLAESGINWLVVFWTNGSAFQSAWEDAAKYAKQKGIQLAKGMYAYSGGGPEYLMAEPDAPDSILTTSPKGEKTAICPFDEAGRRWVHSQLPDRLYPEIGGIFIEPSRMISRQCICPKCSLISAYEWDVLVLNDIADELRSLNRDILIIPYVYMPPDKEGMLQMAKAYKELKQINHVFAWGADDEQTLTDWLETDSRFEVYTKIGRVQLFPNGERPSASAEERAETVFRWCRRAAELGRTHYLFDYRVFGGREWQGHLDNSPVTRASSKIPASIKLMGAAMKDPYKETGEQKRLLASLRTNADWDLDDPGYFYFGG
jgi:hypothetical protein